MRYKGLKGKAWEILRSYVYERDNWTCVTCGKRADQGFVMNAGHFQPVGLVGSNNRLSWDEENVYCQCARCNGFGQGEQIKMAEHITRVHGKKKVKELQDRRYRIDPIKDWQSVIDEYKTKLAQIKSVRF